MSQTKPSELKKSVKKERPSAFGVIFGAIVALFFIGFIFLLTIAYDVWALKRDAREALSSVQAFQFKKAAENIHEIRIGILSYEWWLTRACPFESCAELGKLANAAASLAGSAEDLMYVADSSVPDRLKTPKIFADWAMVPSSDRRLILVGLKNSDSGLHRSARLATSARLTLDEVDLKSISPLVRNQASEIHKQLKMAAEADEMLSAVAELLPTLLGVPESTSMILVLQNSDELRPTGGFIGTYATIQSRDGLAELSDVRDVYRLDDPSIPYHRVKPPEPFQKYLGQTSWFFRDANWWPDFQKSGANLLEMYRRERGANANEMKGVVAINPEVVEKMVAMVGCLTVEGVEFCPENFIEKLQYEVEKGFEKRGVAYADRKSIVAPLVRAFMPRFIEVARKRTSDLVSIALDGVRRKDIQIYMTEPTLEGALDRARLSGATTYETADGIMVVDTNLGGLKTDPYVKRDYTYTIKSEGDKMIGTLKIHYFNTAIYKTWKTAMYRTYARVFLPSGTKWLSTSGSLLNDPGKNPDLKPGRTDVSFEDGRVVLGAFTAVDLWKTQDLIFRFELAPEVVKAINDKKYSLTILRQSGSLDPNFTLQLTSASGEVIKASAQLSEDTILEPFQR